MTSFPARPAASRDDVEPVDVVALSRAVLADPRKETMTSQREVRALATAIIDFDEALQHASKLVFLIGCLYERPESVDLKAGAEQSLGFLNRELLKIGYLTEDIDDAAL